MRNLKYFCHYHYGKPHERAIKIIGSLLIATMAYVWGASTQVISASEDEAYFIGNLITEPVYMASQDGIGTSTGGGGEGGFGVSQSTSGDTGYGNYPPGGGSGGYVDDNNRYPQSYDGGSGGDESQQKRNEYGKYDAYSGDNGGKLTAPSFDEEEEFDHEAERVKREARDTLRGLQHQVRELKRICRQLKRLKTAESDTTECEATATQLSDIQTRLKLSDTDSVSDALDEYRDMDLEELFSTWRYKAELPRMINSIFKDLTRLNKVLASKAIQKYFDSTALSAKTQEWLSIHAEAKQAYANGDYELVQETLETFREVSPGSCIGAVRQLKGFKSRMRGIKDKDLAAELDELLSDPINMLGDGECQAALESFYYIERELNDILNNDIMYDSEVSDEFMKKIFNLKEKFLERDE